MVAPSSEPWIMHVALNLNRKRSRLIDDEEDADCLPPLASPLSDTLKKTKTESELDEIGIVSPADAWPVDVKSILESPTLPKAEGSALEPHNNVSNYSSATSLLVLCVQGDCHLHYDLLCSQLLDLYTIAPSLQALVLCRDPSTHVPSTSASISLPLVQAVGPEYNHFVRLGLLHPLGGGHYPLDALVVVDTRGRRRLVLPFGWGAGRHAADIGGGRTVQNRLMEMLRKCIQTLSQE
ncbi:uncharacterized protein BDR25DRAFT_255355 [Lindgomyces ingoldianus]|uniref:Uncharacterized protein n=1 Tax=Lindgomyces ingoldianus TaxID=673940 RepID=A0ACB6R6S5_9PLEO|nr:uncharacterized protein BDR25DRAFT_255355 [Lindgomyces ingoldianus]KAF2474866.1 hypothetical protein BDR25DRAFT_255355 [Lindgomyces ingoldianus]